MKSRLISTVIFILLLNNLVKASPSGYNLIRSPFPGRSLDRLSPRERRAATFAPPATRATLPTFATLTTLATDADICLNKNL